MQTLGNVVLCVAGFQYVKKNTFFFLFLFLEKKKNFLPRETQNYHIRTTLAGFSVEFYLQGSSMDRESYV